MENKSTKYILITAFIGAVILYFVFRKIALSVKPDNITLPSTAKVDANGNVILVPANSVNYDPKPVTDKIASKVLGLSNNLFGDTSIYELINTLNDTQLALVINDWNQRYFPKNKETLRQALQAERFLPWGSAIDMVGVVLTRIKKLGG